MKLNKLIPMLNIANLEASLDFYCTVLPFVRTGCRPEIVKSTELLSRKTGGSMPEQSVLSPV